MRLIVAMFGLSLPVVLSVWALEPAQPWAYPSVEQLLFDSYQGAATELDKAVLNHRRLLLYLAAAFSLGSLLVFAGSLTVCWLAGVFSGLLCLQPSLVPWLLGGVWQWRHVGVALVMYLAGLLLILFCRRFNALAMPMGCLALLLALHLSVQMSAKVLIRSNPPLQVLVWLSQPDPEAHELIAGGMHYLSLGGRDRALPLLRDAALLLLKNNPENPEVREALSSLAALPLAETE